MQALGSLPVVVPIRVVARHNRMAVLASLR